MHGIPPNTEVEILNMTEMKGIAYLHRRQGRKAIDAAHMLSGSEARIQTCLERVQLGLTGWQKSSQDAVLAKLS